MKKFVVKFIFASVLLNTLFYFYVEWNKERMLRGEYVYWDVQMKRIDGLVEVDDKVNKLFVGDSRVASGITTRAFPNSHNLGLSGSSVVNSYYALKRYLKTHPNSIDTIIMSFSPFLLIEGNDEEHFWEYSGKFKFHTWAEILEINSVCQQLNDQTTLGSNILMEYLLYKYNWVYYYQANVRNAGDLRLKSNMIFRKEIVENNGDVKYESEQVKFDTLFLESTYENFKISPVKEYYVKEIFKLCQEHNLHVIYTTMPLNKYNYHYCKKRFINDFKGYLADLYKSYPNYDIDPDLHVYSADLFGDYSHLSRKGALHFSDELKWGFFD